MATARERILEAQLRSLALAARVYLAHRFDRPKTRELLADELISIETWLREHPAGRPVQLPEPDLAPAPEDPLEGRAEASAPAPDPRPRGDRPTNEAGRAAADAWKARAPYADA
ncbi:hypothetical protein SAMN06265365_14814 [Tistlia consotensis]|uniref:Uncharacterized protein n=1 Tax=Tistlia consotensis USBA 355 TaxID=560819 RepID=A0A1Y6CYB9_9PROT|nr:hypothetical protein [Tistlia consotensis]SMF82873.1 hypothetical protein SAMN05428998_14815 [Tistlia consotensis USBA 355]SNS31239.1 hypothetical protein SAMN06265365_14814 [Tistlia consotensis]